MDIDMTTLRMIEQERDISLDMLAGAIEQALLSAYHRTEGAYTNARVELDRRSGHVSVYAREVLTEADELTPAELGPEFDDTPADFGRIATATARQVILQRLRDAEDDQVLGQYRDKQDEVVAGVIPQGPDPREIGRAAWRESGQGGERAVGD